MVSVCWNRSGFKCCRFNRGSCSTSVRSFRACLETCTTQHTHTHTVWGHERGIETALKWYEACPHRLPHVKTDPSCAPCEMGWRRCRRGDRYRSSTDPKTRTIGLGLETRLSVWDILYKHTHKWEKQKLESQLCYMCAIFNALACTKIERFESCNLHT